jgi:uncharacterized protein (DUF1697 family)/uncharacterized protein YdhG (YjbR/CyaY superfamily)
MKQENAMSSAEVDSYLLKLDKQKRAMLEKVRKAIRAIVPDATEGLSYGMPAFFKGKAIAGYSASAEHCSYHPMSGNVIAALKHELKDYATSKGTIRFSADSPLPPTLIRKLVKARIAEIEQSKKAHATPRIIALLRAVNVGGTGKLAMADLRAVCQKAGYKRVETYIASGNVVFESDAHSDLVKTELEKLLHAHTGKPVGVIVRTAAEMKVVLKDNPFPGKPPNFTAVFFLDEEPNDILKGVSGQANEELKAHSREIYVYFPTGMGQSKLKIPAAKNGTTRNINTVAKLAEMASR